MLVLFPSDPFDTWKVDADWAEEARIAQECGHEVAYVHYESLVNDGDARQAVKRVPDQEEPSLAIYRGWMLTASQYEALYGALQSHLVDLLTSPDSYEAAHHLPGWYDALEGRTPESRWFPLEDLRSESGMDWKAVVEAAREMAPCIIKDYVKSRKHEWKEACFIPDAAAASDVVANFLERQDDSLQGGLVLRKFVPLKSIGKHPQSGMPMSEEYRFFWLNGHVACLSEYWPEEMYETEEIEMPEPEGGWEEGMGRTITVPKSIENLPSFDELAEFVRGIGSPFFTMDLAMTEDEEWIVMEIGDGQVSGFPQMPTDAQKFYPALEPFLNHRHAPPPHKDASRLPALTRVQIDPMTCAVPGCDHTDHDGGMVMHPRCHVGTPTWCSYGNGVLTISCAECDQVVARIAVDPGEPVRD